MTIEEKAKRYDEVVAMAKDCITYIPDEAVNKYMLNMFPELKESEDKKVRRMLREIVLQWKNGHQAWCSDDKEIDAILAWLEKQDEQKPADWKPDDEQMKALDIAIRCGIQLGTWEETALKSLKEQLIHLKKK